MFPVLRLAKKKTIVCFNTYCTTVEDMLAVVALVWS